MNATCTCRTPRRRGRGSCTSTQGESLLGTPPSASRACRRECTGFGLGGATRFGRDLRVCRQRAVTNDQRVRTDIDRAVRRLTMTKALLARLEVAESAVHGIQRDCEKPAGYEGR